MKLPKVFAVYRPEYAGLVSVWAQSWRAHGWMPRLITAKDLQDFRSVKRAVRKLGPGKLVDCRTINFAFKQRTRGKTVKFLKRGWEVAPLVRFPKGATGFMVLSCGRHVDFY